MWTYGKTQPDFTCISARIELDLDGETVEYDALVDFDYQAGYDARLIGNPDNYYEGIADEWQLRRVQIEVSNGLYADINAEQLNIKILTSQLDETITDFILKLSDVAA